MKRIEKYFVVCLQLKNIDNKFEEEIQSAEQDFKVCLCAHVTFGNGCHVRYRSCAMSHVSD